MNVYNKKYVEAYIEGILRSSSISCSIYDTMFTIPKRDGLINTDTEIEGKGNTSLSIISESESKNTEKELNQALLDFRKNIDANESNASIQEEDDRSSKQSVANFKSF